MTAARTPLLTNATGDLDPVEGVNTVEVLDYDTPKSIVAKFSSNEGRAAVMRKGISGLFDEPVTDGFGKQVVLSNLNRDVTLTTPDVYGLRGEVVGTITAYQIQAV